MGQKTCEKEKCINRHGRNAVARQTPVNVLGVASARESDRGGTGSTYHVTPRK